MCHQQYFDVVIVGAGPAGLFAGLNIALNSHLSILILDKGKPYDNRKCAASDSGRCSSCSLCNVISGVGGASTIFGGKLCFYPAGNALDEINTPYHYRETADEFLYDVLDLPPSSFLEDPTPKNFRKKTHGTDIEFKFYDTHIVLQKTMQSFVRRILNLLARTNVIIKPESLVRDINVADKQEFLVEVSQPDKHCTYRSRHLILATGRSGTKWLQGISDKLGVLRVTNTVDLGIRIEMPRAVFSNCGTLVLNADPKFKINKNSDKEVRTFCACIGGEVTTYRLNSLNVIDGHFGPSYSNKANIGIVARIKPPIPHDTFGFAMQFVANLSMGRARKPIVQKLDEFRSAKTSSWHSISSARTEPSLADAIPGNISRSMPSSVSENLLSALDVLEDILPGIADYNNLVYAPVIDRFWDRYELDEVLQTNIKNLFIVGDAGGYARGILQAAWSGIIASIGILRNRRSVRGTHVNATFKEPSLAGKEQTPSVASKHGIINA